MSSRERYTLDDLKTAWPEVEHALRPRPRATRATVTAPIASTYAKAALEQETAAVAKAGEGSRNYTANKAAFNLGQLVGAGALDEHEVTDALLAAALAAENPLTRYEAEKTIRRGIAAGKRHPREGAA